MQDYYIYIYSLFQHERREMQKHLVAFKGQEVSSSVLMYENDFSSVFGSGFLSPFIFF